MSELIKGDGLICLEIAVFDQPSSDCIDEALFLDGSKSSERHMGCTQCL